MKGKNSAKSIEMEDVWKKYDMGEVEPLVVLSDINLEIKRGEFVAITGPSGSGKSTMLNLVGVLDKPSWGRVILDNQNISFLRESDLAILRGKKIGFIFQQFNLIKTLSALENVMLPMEALDILSKKESEQRAIALLTVLGLQDRLHHKPNQLSGGQQQRVAIARALANDPEIILADEPTGNLDSHTGQFVMEFLQKLNKQGKTIILITHDPNLKKYAKRIINIMDGKIISPPGKK
ncbi:putative ABC transporter ATP-binding protein [uncultured archaeon]|nr:putative ABC transporter ATP-binding protein [uncultured archaeon]